MPIKKKKNLALQPKPSKKSKINVKVKKLIIHPKYVMAKDSVVDAYPKHVI